MPKNITICYDGTGNEYGNHNTNVVGVFEAIIRDQEQRGFYDPGVGTFSVLGRSLGRHVGTLLGKAFGAGLRENIEEGYEYLMREYDQDDQVFLFGFSRGAFTVRALAGMLYRFGLLERGSRNLIPYVSKNYLNHQFEFASDFKTAFCRECKPHFIGVWDTVGSLGHIHGKKFYDTELNEDIRYGYHAVAIDERRKKFPVSLWDESKKKAHQTIEQVWFAGVHSDVGAWYEERQLCAIAFAWMIDEASKRGLRLRRHWRKRLVQDAAGPIHVSRNGFWKLWRPLTRTIPEAAKVHQSVLDRIERVREYRPQLPAKRDVRSNPSYEAEGDS